MDSRLRRRALLASAGLGMAAAMLRPAHARTPRAQRTVTVAQLFDSSPEQYDISKDILIGSRGALQDLNARGGADGVRVQHVSIEVDGTAASLDRAIATLKDDPSIVALFGTCGDPLARRVVRALHRHAVPIAHVAPWLQNATEDVDDLTFPIFAGRQEQISHALRTLTVVGIQDVGAVYATPGEYALYREDLERAAAALKLRLQTFRADGDLDRVGQRLTPGTPAVLLFVGGTPELVQFTQGLERQQRQRYVVALADVNLQTMQQMGGGRSIPVIATQAVPMVTAPLPVVRAYRDMLGRLFDEAPAALSLAGFIAARYTAEVLAGVTGQPTRQSVLAAFQRRAPVDLGGFQVSYDARRRGSSSVTQSMLTQDGRVVG